MKNIKILILSLFVFNLHALTSFVPKDGHVIIKIEKTLGAATTSTVVTCESLLVTAAVVVPGTVDCSNIKKITINGTNLKDSIDLSAVTRTIFPALATVTIYAGAGNDLVYGSNIKDTIYGGSGNDTIYGLIGDDVIYGESGNDLIYGGVGKDKIYGDSGNDTIYGQEGVDTIYGNSGNDIIYGGPGADTIRGGSGRNSIFK